MANPLVSRGALAAALVLTVAACGDLSGPSSDEPFKTFRASTTTTSPPPTRPRQATTLVPTSVPGLPAANLGQELDDPRVLILGDSVLAALGGSPPLAETVLAPLGWKVQLDASKRQPAAVAGAARKLVPEVGQLAVVQVGNDMKKLDALALATQVDAALAALAPVRKVVLLTLQEDVIDKAGLNGVLRLAAAKDPDRVVLLDWNSLVQGLQGVNEDDGVHLNPKGAEVLARLIASVLGPAPS
ncbi:MAG TPA: hypothetical protein VF855_01000 [Acidimicrobiales bacterium]